METIKFFEILLLIWLIIIVFILIMMKVFDLIFDKMEAKVNTEDLKNKFYDTLDVVSKQSTKEILECLIEMEQLDKIYKLIEEQDKEFMDELSYLRLKESALSKIIDEKINSIKGQKKQEQYESLIEEIKTCQKRYPEYNEIYVDKKNLINEKRS